MTETTGLMKHVVAAMSETTGPTGQGKPPFLRAVALVCWAALSGACGDRSGDPMRAAQAFTAVVQRGDMDAVYPLLDAFTVIFEGIDRRFGMSTRVMPALAEMFDSKVVEKQKALAQVEARAVPAAANANVGELQPV